VAAVCIVDRALRVKLRKPENETGSVR
jgi:hypothetical protein